MDQKWIWILVILVFSQKVNLGAGEGVTLDEGQPYDINCGSLEGGSMIIWFRVLATGMEFIASFSPNGKVAKTTTSTFSSLFRHTESHPFVLTLKEFRSDRDTGTYSCATLVKGNELRFGKLFRLAGKKVAMPAPLAPTTTKQSPCTTATPCVCGTNNKQEEANPSMLCAPIILGPLAGGCGLLLLLLIITILYCNRIRTRRCPHHHNRKPRPAPGKQMMTNRHV